jgi:hypothetical protein
VEAIREEGRRREALSSSRKEERTREQSRQQNKMLQCSESLYRIVRVVMIRQGKGARRKRALCPRDDAFTYHMGEVERDTPCVRERLFCFFASPKTNQFQDCPLFSRGGGEAERDRKIKRDCRES